MSEEKQSPAIFDHWSLCSAENLRRCLALNTSQAVLFSTMSTQERIPVKTIRGIILFALMMLCQTPAGNFLDSSCFILPSAWPRNPLLSRRSPTSGACFRRSVPAMCVEKAVDVRVAGGQDLGQVASVRYRAFPGEMEEREIYLDAINRLAQGGCSLIATIKQLAQSTEEEPPAVKNLRDLLAYQWITLEDFEKKRAAILASMPKGGAVVGAVDLSFPREGAEYSPCSQSRCLFLACPAPIACRSLHGILMYAQSTAS